MSTLFKTVAGNIKIRSAVFSAPGYETAIELVGGDGGATTGARILWSHGVGGPGNEVYLDSANPGQIICKTDSGTFGIRSLAYATAPQAEPVEPYSEAVLDTDVHADETQAAAHVILRTQFHQTRVNDNGSLNTDGSFSVFTYWPIANPFQPDFQVTSAGTYCYRVGSPGNWLDGHAIHVDAIGGMSPEPSSDLIGIDFRANSLVGDPISPKPWIGAMNINDVRAKLIMSDGHPYGQGLETAKLELGGGEARFAFNDGFGAGSNKPDTLVVQNGRVEIFDNSNFGMGSPNTILSLYGGLRGDTTFGAIGDGARIRFEGNGGDGYATTYVAIETHALGVNSGTDLAGALSIHVAAAGASTDGPPSPAFRIEPTGLSLRFDSGAGQADRFAVRHNLTDNVEIHTPLGTLTFFNNAGGTDAPRLTLSSHVDVWSLADYDAGFSGNGLDFQGPFGSTTPGSAGYGQKIRLRCNSDVVENGLISYAALSLEVANPTSVGAAGRVRLGVLRAGIDVDSATSASMVFDGTDLSVRIWNELGVNVGGLTPDHLLLQAPNGTMWRVAISNDGSVTTMEN